MFNHLGLALPQFGNTQYYPWCRAVRTSTGAPALETTFGPAFSGETAAGSAGLQRGPGPIMANQELVVH